ncbi:MAG: hypothetical protein GPOALKHO_000455 [Sodalis sp.]|nr:MAG: hypothetical protein GPOALKHO_000455 [Sodalis sp.]
MAIIVRAITVTFQYAAERGNPTAMSWIHRLALVLQAMRIVIPVVIVDVSVGTSALHNMLSSIPEVVTNGLNITDGMIVVVGYAMVINMMRASYLMPFFIPQSSLTHCALRVSLRCQGRLDDLIFIVRLLVLLYKNITTGAQSLSLS